MDSVKIGEIDYTNHEGKCRICFKSFGNDEHRVEISKLIEKKFREVTSTIVNKTKKFFSSTEFTSTSFVSASTVRRVLK